MAYAVFFLLICFAIWICFIDYEGVVSDKLLCIFMFPLMAFVSTNDDKAGYELMYDYIDSLPKVGFTDPGFGSLMFIGRTINLDYMGFLAVFTLLGLFFVTITLKRICKLPSIVLAVYFVTLFPTYTIQLRCFISEVILYVLIIKFLNEEHFDLKGFLALLFIAILFHATSTFFILLLLAVFAKSYKQLLSIVMMAIVVVPVTAYILKYVPIPMIQEKIQYYFVYRESSSVGSILLIMMYVFVTCVIYYFMERTDDPQWQIQLERLLRVNIIGLIACALILVFNSNYYRLNRVILMVDLIFVMNKSSESSIIQNSRNRSIIAMIVIVLFAGKEMLTNTIMGLSFNNTVLSSFLDLI